MNILTYSETGDARWHVPMPTFLVDGEDIVHRLLGTDQRAFAGIAGVGIVSMSAFQYPTPTVFSTVPEGAACRQVILHVHLGDWLGDFVTATVHRRVGTVTWSEFDSVDGVHTPLLPAGPFVFSIEQYAAVLASVCVQTFQRLRDSWSLPEEALQATWAWDWHERSRRA